MFDISYCDVIYYVIYAIAQSHKPPFRLAQLSYVIESLERSMVDMEIWSNNMKSYSPKY